MKFENQKSKIKNQKSKIRGVSLVELLAAVILLAIVSAGAAATWSLSSRVPANKRVTDMGSIVAVREIERVKSRKFLNVADSTATTYYDKLGAPTTDSALYKYLATTVISTVANRDGVANTEDLVQVQVTVQNPGGTVTYETQRTLMAFGGF